LVNQLTNPAMKRRLFNNRHMTKIAWGVAEFFQRAVKFFSVALAKSCYVIIVSNLIKRIIIINEVNRLKAVAPIRRNFVTTIF